MAVKPRRGIDLTASVQPADCYEYRHTSGVYDTVSGMREWELLGARCGKCGRTSWLDKAAVVRRYRDQYLHNVGAKLVCRCGNADGNVVMVGTLGRD